MEPVHNHLGGDGVDRLVAFIVARERIRLKKEGGFLWPWTEDPILQTYRFCNVHRQDDAVTRWIHCNVLWPQREHPDVWLLMCVCRLLNNVETLAELGLDEWLLGMDDWRRIVRKRQARGERVFNPAYMITTAGKKQDKVHYIFDLLRSLWERREQLRPEPGDTLNSWHMALGMFDGLGSFLAGQVVADMRYVEPLLSASDWKTFACSGPGSRRGLNRVMGRPVKSSWSEDEWRRYVSKLQVYVNTGLRRYKIELHGQDLQNCLCEHDKYERARLGEGKPKQLYRRATNG